MNKIRIRLFIKRYSKNILSKKQPNSWIYKNNIIHFNFSIAKIKYE